jgi:hypothetical protein
MIHSSSIVRIANESKLLEHEEVKVYSLPLHFSAIIEESTR